MMCEEEGKTQLYILRMWEFAVDCDDIRPMRASVRVSLLDVADGLAALITANGVLSDTSTSCKTFEQCPSLKVSIY